MIMCFLIELYMNSTQAVSKWENGHSLPETALLPELARALGVSIDTLFNQGDLLILDARFGDGFEAHNVTKRMNILVENGVLESVITAAALGCSETSTQCGRVRYLTVKYQTRAGICHTVFKENDRLKLTSNDVPRTLPTTGLEIIAGSYGTQARHYDVMKRIEHFRVFNWDAYHANHEIFPSDPANDTTEYLTLVYLNTDGIQFATCAEGEALAYDGNKTRLYRQLASGEYYIPDVHVMEPFGAGKECSWAHALTVALQAMGVSTSYEEVMGVSGACYRIAFCSPGWDYSSVDGLVAYDYATPGYAAFGYTPEMHSRIEKADRPAHRSRITKELRNNMPVLGINLRVAHEWGVICGYAKDGEDLFCRTKYDIESLDGPEALRGRYHYDYLYVDNWPFLLCYFKAQQKPPTPPENLLASLRVFADCAAKEGNGGYHMGFKAYEVWSADLRDDMFYEGCDDELLARRFSVDQFCTLSLADARRSAHAYLKNAVEVNTNTPEYDTLLKIVECFEKISEIAGRMNRMLDSGEYLEGERARRFWTAEMRHTQADMLDEMARVEHEAYMLAKGI